MEPQLIFLRDGLFHPAKLKKLTNDVNLGFRQYLDLENTTIPHKELTLLSSAYLGGVNIIEHGSANSGGLETITTGKSRVIAEVLERARALARAEGASHYSASFVTTRTDATRVPTDYFVRKERLGDTGLDTEVEWVLHPTAQLYLKK